MRGAVIRFEIKRWSGAWPEAELAALVEESAGEGWRHLQRLRDDWRSGANRFDADGEGFWIGRCAGRVAAVCGLNLDPYAGDPAVARLRRLYVARGERRRGLGRLLVSEVLACAADCFDEVRLRTRDVGAETFFLGLGFERAEDVPEATHRLRLTGR